MTTNRLTHLSPPPTSGAYSWIPLLNIDVIVIFVTTQGSELQRRGPDPQQEGEEHFRTVPGETRRQDCQTDEGVCRETALHAGWKYCINIIYKSFTNL